MAYPQQSAFVSQGSPRGMPRSGEDLRLVAAVLQDIMPVLSRIQVARRKRCRRGLSVKCRRKQRRR